MDCSWIKLTFKLEFSLEGVRLLYKCIQNLWQWFYTLGPKKFLPNNFSLRKILIRTPQEFRCRLQYYKRPLFLQTATESFKNSYYWICMNLRLKCMTIMKLSTNSISWGLLPHCILLWNSDFYQLSGFYMEINVHITVALNLKNSFVAIKIET